MARFAARGGRPHPVPCPHVVAAGGVSGRLVRRGRPVGIPRRAGAGGGTGRRRGPFRWSRVLAGYILPGVAFYAGGGGIPVGSCSMRIVFQFLLGVCEHLVCRLDSLKLCVHFCFLPRVTVRVVLEGLGRTSVSGRVQTEHLDRGRDQGPTKFPELLLDFRDVRLRRQIEIPIIVTAKVYLHHHDPLAVVLVGVRGRREV